MDRDPRRGGTPPLHDVLRDIVVARRRQDGLVMAALAFGAELLECADEDDVAARSSEILIEFAVDETEIARDPQGALRADMARDRARLRAISHECAPGQDDPRGRQLALLYEVRGDLLEVMTRCRKSRFGQVDLVDEMAHALGAATDKLVTVADMDTYQAWQRGMLLKLTEIPHTDGAPRVLATVDAGPGREPLTVDWDSCERRLALVTRLMRAGISPVIICDRLLADLSCASPLRYSQR